MFQHVDLRVTRQPRLVNTRDVFLPIPEHCMCVAFGSSGQTSSPMFVHKLSGVRTISQTHLVFDSCQSNSQNNHACAQNRAAVRLIEACFCKTQTSGQPQTFGQTTPRSKRRLPAKHRLPVRSHSAVVFSNSNVSSLNDVWLRRRATESSSTTHRLILRTTLIAEVIKFTHGPIAFHCTHTLKTNGLNSVLGKRDNFWLTDALLLCISGAVPTSCTGAAVFQIVQIHRHLCKNTDGGQHFENT